MTERPTMISAPKPTEPIGGHATYLVEDEFLVTLTARLVIASPQRTQIEAVLRRLNGEETTSLATAAQLKSIPAGSAGFVIGALNESSSRHADNPKTAQHPPYLSAMDFGRELFANITSFAAFVLPSDGTPPADALPIPDAALVFTVVDPSKSQELWQQVLGIASLASGAGTTIEGRTQSVGSVDVHTYRFPAGVGVHCAVSGKDVLIASSISAMERALAARPSGKSVLDDPAFAQLLKRLDPNTTKAIVVHAGRALEIATRFAPSKEAAEMESFLEVLTDTVASLVVDHSAGKFHFATRLHGIPQIGDFVDQFIVRKENEEALDDQVRRAMRSEEWDTALGVLETLLADQPGNYRLLRKKFDIHAVHKSDRGAAQAAAAELLDAIEDNATLLNNFAWALLTEERYQSAHAELALKVSERSNKLTHNKNWRFVDTLALAKFETGDVEAAITLEKKAIHLAPEDGAIELRKAIARFEETLNSRP